MTYILTTVSKTVRYLYHNDTIFAVALFVLFPVRTLKIAGNKNSLLWCFYHIAMKPNTPPFIAVKIKQTFYGVKLLKIRTRTHWGVGCLSSKGNFGAKNKVFPPMGHNN